jgi:disulfide bond formation protein DsbB
MQAGARLMHRLDSRWAAALGVVAILALLSAFVMQYGFGLAPCHLCILERWPYLVAAAAVLAGLLMSVPRAALLAVALAMAVGATIAAYHVGVEQGMFALPESCVAGDRAQSIDQLREMLTHAGPRCDQVTAEFLGFSLAFWNLLLSLGLSVAALVGFWWTRPVTS